MAKAVRTQAETETVIVFNDADEFAIMDTSHGRFRKACEEAIRRTGRGGERNPTDGRVDGRKVRWEFEIPKECIRVPLAPRQPKRLTAEDRERIGERLRNARSCRDSLRVARVGAPNAPETA